MEDVKAGNTAVLTPDRGVLCSCAAGTQSKVPGLRDASEWGRREVVRQVIGRKEGRAADSVGLMEHLNKFSLQLGSHSRIFFSLLFPVLVH